MPAVNSNLELHVTQLVTHLRAQQYSQGTIYRYVAAARRLLRWLISNNLQLVHLTEDALDDFVKDRTRQCSRNHGRNIKSLLVAFLRFTLAKWPPSRENTETEETDISSRLIEYRADLQDRKGLAESTIRHRVNEAKLFLKHFRKLRPSAPFRSIRMADLDSYLEHRASTYCRESMCTAAVDLRAFIRYLFIGGVLQFDLSVNIDGPTKYMGAKVPDVIDDKTTRAILRIASKDATLSGKRDYAILLLLTEQGLRTNEIRNLELDDIDWVKEETLIRATKVRKEFRLPLLRAPLNAIIDYLRVRPASDSRRIFLLSRAPYTPLSVRSTFGTMIERRAAQAGIRLTGRRGGHVFRHSFTRRLLKAGVSLKLIGDVLGHSSGRSTMMYLKIAHNDLLNVALDLPGRSK